MLKYGFIIFLYDEAVFIHPKYKILLACHVNDIFVTGPNVYKIKEIFNKIFNEIKLLLIGDLHSFLGCKITINNSNKTVNISQIKYTKALLNKFGKRYPKVNIPALPGIKLRKSTKQASKLEIHDFQSQIGGLLYLALKTRPDIAFSVIKLNRYITNPDNSHFNALNRIWQYLTVYPNLGLFYNCDFIINNNNNAFIKIYYDSDWAGDLNDKKSTKAFITLIGNNPINWGIKKQKTVSTLSTETEYMALAKASKKAIYINNVFKYLNEFLNSFKLYKTLKAPLILTDNLLCKELSANNTHYEKTKHINIVYHFIRKNITENRCKIVHINDPDQLADALTKAVVLPKFNWFIKKLASFYQIFKNSKLKGK